MITKEDFFATIHDQLFFGTTRDSIDKSAVDCFELAKKMSIHFARWCYENKHFLIGNDIWTDYTTKRTISGQEIFELYQQSKTKP